MGSQGKQHFSHHHVLISLNDDEGVPIICKACNQLISENFHGCISCKFYLHDVCMNAPRSLEHPSHPSHPLALLPTPTYSNQSYTCSACGFEGKGFSLSCAHCEFDLHVQCSSLPNTLVLDKHPHELKLIYNSPYEDKSTKFSCDLCCGVMKNNHWLYYCEVCCFKVHLDCATSKICSKEDSNEQRKGKQKAKIKVDRHVEMLQKRQAHQAHRAKLKAHQAAEDLEWIMYCREQNYF
ncbi:Cysteine/Histidine-rich C1 domain family protein [Forsythia ovata]|uniref:Cysteine/Histidine-rich C1 domain family protein n=1 Tax=Forsythia ovata TaxID=205694 RepID=A0ABD1TMZ5_9LAMI